MIETPARDDGTVHLHDPVVGRSRGTSGGAVAG